MKPHGQVLTAFYDLAVSPVSWDFIGWLIRALMEAQRRGTLALHVVIVPKEDGLGGFARRWGEHDAAATWWRLWHIVIAACPLASATVTLAATRAQAEAMRCEPCWWPQGKAHFIRPIVDAARQGQTVPQLSATPAAARYVNAWLGEKARPIVTLTERHQSTDPARNSNRPMWAWLCQWLEERGYRVIRLRDSNDALAAGQGYAELDPDLRLALYERAHLNCIGNNGPSQLLWFSAAPYLMFNAALPAEPWRAHWQEHQGLATGQQLPWAKPYQRLVYAPDDFATLSAEVQRWAGETN